MKPCSKMKCILLIDQQPYWREFSAHAFQSVSFFVCPLATYPYVIPQDCVKGEDPDLIVLGRTRIGPEEQQLITHILAYKHHLLMLCTSLSWQVMRSLFLQGSMTLQINHMTLLT